MMKYLRLFSAAALVLVLCGATYGVSTYSSSTYAATTYGGAAQAETHFFEDFDTAPGATRWTEVTAGTGDVAQSGSELAFDDGGAATGAATLYHNEVIDVEKFNQYWITGRMDQDVDAIFARIRYGVPSTGATENDSDMLRIEFDSAGDNWNVIYQNSVADLEWNRSGGAWDAVTGDSAYPDVRDLIGYQIMIEIIPSNFETGGTVPHMRVLMWMAAANDLTYGFDGRGYKMIGQTDWITLANADSLDDLYFALGDGETDAIDSDTTIEHVAWSSMAPVTPDTPDLPDSQWAYLNSSANASFPVKYNITAHYTLAKLDTENINAWYVPWDEDGGNATQNVSGLVLARGGSTLDDQWVSRPSVVHVGATYYMVYDCRDDGGTPDTSAGDLNQICGATATHPLGPWSTNSNNPILDIDDGLGPPVGNEDWKFATLYYDSGEADEFKMLVNNETDGDIYLFDADVADFNSSFDLGGWNRIDEPLSVGIATWDDWFVAQPTLWMPQTSEAILFYAGYDNNAAFGWQIGCATPSETGANFWTATNSWSKCAGNPIYTADFDTPQTTTSGNSDGRTLNVLDTTPFEAGDWITVASVNGDEHHIDRVKSKDSGTQLTLYYGYGRITTGKGVSLYSKRSAAVRDIRREGSKVRMYITAFRFSDGSESTSVLETDYDSDLTDNTWDEVKKPWGIPATLEADRVKFIENMKFIGGEL